MLQAKAAGIVGDIFDMRRIIAGSVAMKRYEPADKEMWDNAYEKFKSLDY